MKKALLIASLLVLISCKKEYECSCSIYDKTTGQKQPGISEPVTAKSKDQAQDYCTKQGEESTSYLITCRIQ